MLNDLRFALRTLRRSPGFTLVAILSLALGIGANTAIFSLLYQVVLRSVPVRDPQSLVGVMRNQRLRWLVPEVPVPLRRHKVVRK
jgi:hypothetical protein